MNPKTLDKKSVNEIPLEKIIEFPCRYGGISCASYFKYVTNKGTDYFTCAGQHNGGVNEIPLERILCKFGILCKRDRCPFHHEKCRILCKFGSQCDRLKTCPYVHLENKIVKEDTSPNVVVPEPCSNHSEKPITEKSTDILVLSKESLPTSKEIINFILSRGGRVLYTDTTVQFTELKNMLE